MNLTQKIFDKHKKALQKHCCLLFEIALNSLFNELGVRGSVYLVPGACLEVCETAWGVSGVIVKAG